MICQIAKNTARERIGSPNIIGREFANRRNHLAPSPTEPQSVSDSAGIGAVLVDVVSTAIQTSRRSRATR
jgi:hypothetical protein